MPDNADKVDRRTNDDEIMRIRNSYQERLESVRKERDELRAKLTKATDALLTETHRAHNLERMYEGAKFVLKLTAMGIILASIAMLII